MEGNQMKRNIYLFVLLTMLALNIASNGHSTPLDQYASSVLGYSSQYSGAGWAAVQALGAPNAPGYGDYNGAWAPSPQNGTNEYLTLGFSRSVYSDGATIWENWGNGFVTQIDLLDLSEVAHTVWIGVDPSLPGSVVDFQPTWTLTQYLVKGIKIYVDTNHNLGTWEEIDAVRLMGDTASSTVPEPATMLLCGTGIIGLIGSRVRRKVR
jgi:hypothetical protein